MTAVPDLAAWLREQLMADFRRPIGPLCDGLPAGEENRLYEQMARAEMELAILDQYTAAAAAAQPPAAIGQGRAARELRTRDSLEARRELVVWEAVVRLLGSGYRHREGYDFSWAP